ncbi:SUMF1/EgtB/PvdO family nonheme iron enzyme, partial [candidate division KSB1 bacterium]|nr:SUMF1/EgtB/PvdO family nonheme iron enzyme [candidate division KSB1 bacterium]
MKKIFYSMRGCLLFPVFMLVFGGSLYNEQANMTLSRSASSKSGVQAGYGGFIEKFKGKPPKGMVFIPAGTFMMGSKHGSSDEKPTHSVTLGPFLIDTFEVRQKDFEKVMGFNPS